MVAEGGGSYAGRRVRGPGGARARLAGRSCSRRPRARPSRRRIRSPGRGRGGPGVAAGAPGGSLPRRSARGCCRGGDRAGLAPHGRVADGTARSGLRRGVGGPGRAITGAGGPRSGRHRRQRRPGGGPRPASHAGRARSRRARGDGVVPGRDRVGGGEHGRCRDGAAAVGCRRRSGRRGRVPGREHPRRHGGPSQRALRALRLGGGTHRRRPHLAGGEAGGRASGSPCTRGGWRSQAGLDGPAQGWVPAPESECRTAGGSIRWSPRRRPGRRQRLRWPDRGAAEDRCRRRPGAGRRGPAASGSPLPCHGLGLDRHMRSTGTGHHRPALLAFPQAGVGPASTVPRETRPTVSSALLVAGTSSDVGKSAVVAGICRWLHRQGVSVAPFKAQNMSLNAAVTADGSEIGRAQAAQAAAAGVAPEAAMNPVLIKPTGEQDAQVVVMGRVLTHASAAGYQELKDSLLPVVLDALEHLRSRFDVVICEGAGGIAEINLRGSDLANLGLARAASLPVVVVGVIAWVRGLDLDAEDSLALETPRSAAPPVPGGATVVVAVVRLPRLSNFTDFDPLAAEPGLEVRFTDSLTEVAAADLAVLPGTKATVADLAWVRSRGLDGVLVERARTGKPVLGICGGYQMLGRCLDDGVESGARPVAGLGLLPVETVFERDKVLARPRGVATAFGATRLEGYEIHHGRVRCHGGEPVFAIDGAEAEGCRDGVVVGTSWHGAFESDGFRRAFCSWLATVRGVRWIPGTGSFAEARERRLDLLGDLIARHVDEAALHRLIDGSSLPTGSAGGSAGGAELPVVITGLAN